MSKYSSRNRLSDTAAGEIFIQFCRYLSELRSPHEMAQAFGDLLSKQEVAMIAKRLQIAIHLIDGHKYYDICKQLKTSPVTIARINLWLQEAGEGFRLLYERGAKYRIKKRESSKREQEWSRVRRRYPMYFWPQLLMEEIARQANARQRTRILGVMRLLERKGKLTKDIEALRSFLERSEAGIRPSSF